MTKDPPAPAVAGLRRGKRMTRRDSFRLCGKLRRDK
jgi:hypothetical protein